MVANMTGFGKTAYLSVPRFHGLGYVIVIFPVTALRVAAKATELVLRDIKRNGTQEDWLDRMQTRSELYDLIDYDRYEKLDRDLSREAKAR